MSFKHKSLSLAAVFASCATVASGDVTVFTNDDPEFYILHNGWIDLGSLFIMHAADDQDHASSSSPRFYIYDDYDTGSDPAGLWLSSGPASAVAPGDAIVRWHFGWETFVGFHIPQLLTPGDQLDSNDFVPAPFIDDPKKPIGYILHSPALSFDFEPFVPDDTGDTFIVGVSFTLEDGVHYGFIELKDAGHYRYPVRWGYETEPNTPLVVPAAACGNADLNGDGELDFLDISAFLAAYSANEAAADLNGDGHYDFVDISDFIGAYGAGCP